MVERRREEREAERFLIAFMRWQAVLGLLLVLIALLVGRIEPRIRRPFLVLGAAAGLTALLPAVITASATRSRRSRRLEP